MLEFLYLVLFRWLSGAQNGLGYARRPRARLAASVLMGLILVATAAKFFIGTNAAWQRGRFTVLGEALRTEVSSRKEGDRTYTGAYLQASWFFTDDQHRIEDGVLKRVKSGRRPAWELVSTWSRLDAYSQGDGFAGDTLGIGLNYYRSDGIKIMGELNQLDVRKGYQKDQSGLSFILRLQLAF